jgi:L-aspartate oxidase
MTQLTPRYLVSFHPKEIPHRFTDILIIGGGLAGLRAANAAPSDLSVMIVTKDAILQSSSNYAQGGIASVIDPEDRFEDHINDTLAAGGALCDQQIVDMVIREAPDRIAELMQWGTRFDSQAGVLQLGKEGGHSHHRVVHALGDATGREVMRAMVAWTQQSDNIEILENSFTLDLLTHEGYCRGALIAQEDGQKLMVWANQTILCTGGAGQLYRESTNPAVATADGHAAAYRAGVELRDMEFMQFHPTVLYIAGSSRSLITEAIRGEGAYLVDQQRKRFMPDYDERAELAPRDIVSQAIVKQMDDSKHPCVYLLLDHLDPELVKKRFPGITASCAEFGIDVTTDLIPVRPGAHYMIGGVTVNQEGRTTLPGLWAAGEVSSSGLHGANRLASNSLLEGLVYGAHAGQGAGQAVAEMPDDFQALPLDNPTIDQSTEVLDLDDIRNSLKSLMGRNMSVQRTASNLQEASETIDRWRQYVLPRQFSDPQGWELQNLLTVARVMVAAALLREESRGVHLRADYPQIDDKQWKRHLRFRRPEQVEQEHSPVG